MRRLMVALPGAARIKPLSLVDHMENPPVFCWLGNELCLDFHNTTAWTPAGEPEAERITDFQRLIAWAEQAGIVVEGAGASYVRGMSASRQAEALAQAYALRTVLNRVFAAVAQDRGPDPVDVDELNEYLASVVMRVDWAADEDPVMASEASGELNPLLTPVVWSAASLLVSPYRDRIGQCSNPECGWLYVDLSRRGNRRWCDMQTCGNRAKAQRHYDKHRG